MQGKKKKGADVEQKTGYGEKRKPAPKPGSEKKTPLNREDGDLTGGEQASRTPKILKKKKKGNPNRRGGKERR